MKLLRIGPGGDVTYIAQTAPGVIMEACSTKCKIEDHADNDLCLFRCAQFVLLRCMDPLNCHGWSDWWIITQGFVV